MEGDYARRSRARGKLSLSALDASSSCVSHSRCTMNRSILALVLIAAIGSACSAPATPPASGATGDQAPAKAAAAPQPGASQSAAPAAATEPAAPPAPKFHDVTIPADTTLTITLETPLA